MEDTKHISLLVAVSDAKLLQELRGQIAGQEEITLLGEAQDAAQALKAVRRVRPDVVLLDESFSNRQGARADSKLLTAIHQRNRAAKIILVADTCTERSVVEAFEQGAKGCMSKSSLAADCLRAIRAVNRGEVWIGRKEMASVLEDLLNRLPRTDEISGKSTELLSERESEVARAVRLGLTNKEIARRLRISPTTVKTHLENIFHKLHVTHRVQLALVSHSPADEQAESGRVNSYDTDQV